MNTEIDEVLEEKREQKRQKRAKYRAKPETIQKPRQISSDNGILYNVD